jgi:uncharacterized protein YegP (UPF0339 family)
MYLIKKSVDKQFYFVLVAENGETIATSEMYKRKLSCINGILSVRTNAGTKIVDTTKNIT